VRLFAKDKGSIEVRGSFSLSDIPEPELLLCAGWFPMKIIHIKSDKASDGRVQTHSLLQTGLSNGLHLCKKLFSAQIKSPERISTSFSA
jgi:hypothetical protein